MMRKSIVAALVACTVILSGCAGEESPRQEALAEEKIPVQNSAEEASLPKPTESSSEKLPAEQDTQKIQELLELEIYLYEQGCFGVNYDADTPNDDLPRFARVFCQRHDEEDQGQKLIQAATREYFHVDIDPVFAVSGVDLDRRGIGLYSKEVNIEEDTAKILAEIYLNGSKIYDTTYQFYREPLPDSLKGTIFEELSQDGFIWKIQSVSLSQPEAVEQVVEIGTAEEFMEFVNGVNRLDYATVNGRFVLTDDIDLSEMEDFYGIGADYYYEKLDSNSQNYLTPAGFNGELDGAGHKISGFCMEEYAPRLGFFRILNDRAVIKNLHLEGDVINTIEPDAVNTTTGGFAGEISPNAVIENCSFTGRVEGPSCGGFAGTIDNTSSNIHYDSKGFMVGGEGTVRNCTADVQLVCGGYSGGFVGYSAGKVEGCQAIGEVVIDKKFGGIPTNVGGFCGSAYYDVEECSCKARVIHYVEGFNNMGNFAGETGAYDILRCTVDAGVTNPQWPMVGFRDYTESKIEVETK